MTTKSKRNEATARPLSAPDITGEIVTLWNRGGKIDRNTDRCGNLMLSVTVAGPKNEVGRTQVSNVVEQLRPGLNQIDAGYWARCMVDVEKQREYAKRTRSPLSGVAQWLEDGELIKLASIDGMGKRDAQEAIEGSSDLSLVLAIANGGGDHAQIARDHLERVTDGGAAVLGHFGTHDKR